MMVLVFLGVLMSVVCVSHAQESPETLLVIEPSEQFPRNSEGDILQFEDGSLCLVYTRFTSGGSDNSKADLVIRRSGDGGKSWTEDEILVPNEGLENIMSVSLMQLDNGETLLFYLRKNSYHDCILYVRRSQDRLNTVSEPVRVIDAEGFHVVNNDRVVQLSNGRIIVPASYHPRKNGKFLPGGICRAFYSDDNGKTWHPDNTPVGEIPPQDVTLQEPGILELNDGRLWMWMRTNNGYQYECFSSDNGLTWSEPKPSVLASPRSPASIERIPWNGNLLCVWNDHSNWHVFKPQKRTPHCIAVSKDDGKSWCKSRVIEGDPDGFYCYTSITFLDDSAIISYCAGDSVVGGLNRLKVLKMPREWLDME